MTHASPPIPAPTSPYFRYSVRPIRLCELFGGRLSPRHYCVRAYPFKRGGTPATPPKTSRPSAKPLNRLCLSARASSHAKTVHHPPDRLPLGLWTPCSAPCPIHFGRSRLLRAVVARSARVADRLASFKPFRQPTPGRDNRLTLPGGWWTQDGLTPCPTASLRRSDPRFALPDTTLRKRQSSGLGRPHVLDAARQSNTVGFQVSLPLVGSTSMLRTAPGSGAGVNGKMGIRWSNLLPSGIFP